jgi:hypothetical protein
MDTALANARVIIITNVAKTIFNNNSVDKN